MSKTMILTATLPYEVYKAYDRKVHYDYDSSYDEDDDDGCLEPMQSVLYSVIEGDPEVYERLLKDAYYTPYDGDRTHRSGLISNNIVKCVVNLENLTNIKSINVDVDITKFTIRLTISFTNEFEELDHNTLNELLMILAHEGFDKLCDQTVYSFNLEDVTDVIYECDIEMELFEQLGSDDLQYAIEYK